MYEIRKGNRVHIKPSLGDMVYIGEVSQGTFICKDRDNYHKISDSLGLDKDILFANDLKYEFITFKFHGKTYITTRKFFSDKGKERTLLNGRIQLFLPIKEFGLANALRYQKKFSREQLDKLSIFDIKDDDNLFKRWQEELELQEEEKKNSQFVSRKVDI